MAVRRSTVEHVARLARLRLTPEEVERYTAQLSDILEHVEALENVPVEGVDAVGGAAEGGTPLRSDVPGADPLSDPPERFAPAWQEGFFTVPRLAALGGGEDAGEA